MTISGMVVSISGFCERKRWSPIAFTTSGIAPLAAEVTTMQAMAAVNVTHCPAM